MKQCLKAKLKNGLGIQFCSKALSSNVKFTVPQEENKSKAWLEIKSKFLVFKNMCPSVILLLTYERKKIYTKNLTMQFINIYQHWYSKYIQNNKISYKTWKINGDTCIWILKMYIQVYFLLTYYLYKHKSFYSCIDYEVEL